MPALSSPAECRTKVLIYGAGAVGSIFGWRISHCEEAQVSVVCKSNHDQVKKGGFILRTKFWGDGSFVPFQVHEAGSVTSLGTDHDYIVLANKIKTKDDSDRMVEDLQHLINETTTLVSAQNGMDNEVPLRKAFPGNTILTSVCNLVCSQPQPGFVEQLATIKPHAFHIGIFSDGKAASTSDLQALDSLVAMDPQFKVIENAREERWQKLVFNSAWNSMTAIAGMSTHELFTRPASVEVVRQLAREAVEVGIASGVNLSESLPERVVEIARASGSIVTSMLFDVRQGRTVELSPITGYLIAQAAAVGVKVPYTTLIYEQLKKMNQKLQP